MPRIGAVSFLAAGGDSLDTSFLTKEPTTIAWGLIAFDSLASYERYRARLQSDAEARDNFLMARTQRFILREERNFVQAVDATFEAPSAPENPA